MGAVGRSVGDRCPTRLGPSQHKGRKKSRTQVLGRKHHGLGLGVVVRRPVQPDGMAGRERAEPDLAGPWGTPTLTAQSQRPQTQRPKGMSALWVGPFWVLFF